jgi:hypothetical protein
MDMIQQIIQLTTILFLLSMVCERIADFLKYYLSDSQLLGIPKDFFKIGDTITKFPKDDAKEQARAFRIMKINVWSGILLASILKADLIKIFNNITEPGITLGWNNISSYETLDFVLLPFGIILTGCFISFGSKFWHDLLDILYQIKNTKRVLADPETYKVDNVKTLQKLFDTYQSDFIKAAYLEAKTKYMAMDSVKAIGIKSNDLGYYFEITVSQNEPAIGQYYQYLLDDGTPQNIPIKIVVVSDKIIAHSVDLSAKVFDINQQDNWGTLGVIVKPLDNSSTKRYLLTCCHNVVKPIRKVLENEPNPVKAGTIDTTTTEIGTVIKADRDHEMDAALIEIDTLNKKINNSVPQMGNPQKPRQLLNKDAGNVTVFIYGAKSGVENKSVLKGVVTSIYSTIKVTYSNEEFTLINTIAISNNGRAISQGGDSGACVLDSDNNVIGLVVAGNSQVTYALPITTLLTKLNVQLI